MKPNALVLITRLQQVETPGVILPDAMLEVTIQKHEDGQVKRLANVHIENDGRGDDLIASYDVEAYIYRTEADQKWGPHEVEVCRVENFPRNAGGLALVTSALMELGFDPVPRKIRELKQNSRELKETS